MYAQMKKVQYYNIYTKFNIFNNLVQIFNDQIKKSVYNYFFLDLIKIFNDDSKFNVVFLIKFVFLNYYKIIKTN